LGIKKEETFVIGDWTNDISLFKQAGYSATLLNGADELKKIATKVYPFTNDEDGVARIIEDIFF